MSADCSVYCPLEKRKEEFQSHFVFDDTMTLKLTIQQCILYQSGRGLATIFLPEGRDYQCNCCKKGRLVYRDHCKRKVVYEGGDAEWIHIPRHQCDNPACKRITRMLPHLLTPYKHYAEDVIEDTIEERIVPEESDFRPSERTAERWKRWILQNEQNINGYLKSIGHRLLGFGRELLMSPVSLLAVMREKHYNDWLHVIIRTIYNAGAKLDPCYD